MPDAIYEWVIGLEVHAQLQTKSKLFCADATRFGAAPNTEVSAISLGHPGTLPKMNGEAIALAIKLGLATNCSIVKQNYFARKNYFYADLPKGYQVTQHTAPICVSGKLTVSDENGDEATIRINRIHMEEDAGKSMYGATDAFSRIDYNRAGMPLVEIVTEPDIRTSGQAAAYVTALRKLVRHLGVCDGNMEEGSLRCDVNISVRPAGEQTLGTKVEIKNLNSIRFIKKAIENEGRRLEDLHRRGERILQQTRGFNETDNSTYAIRTKEDEDDYRYFPEPDLPPFLITDEMIAAIRDTMPPLQDEMVTRLRNSYGLPEYDSSLVAGDSELYSQFLLLAEHTSNYKAAANWILGPVKNAMIQGDAGAEVSSEALAKLIGMIDEGRISYAIASQKVFPELLNNPLLNIEELVNEKGWFVQTSQSQIDELIEAALEKHASKIPEYKKGKKGLVAVFVGEVMKRSGGTADAQLVTKMITEKLNSK